MTSSLDELKQFVCSDIVKALAAYAYVESFSDYLYSNVVYTLRFLGLPSDEAEKLYSELAKLMDNYLRVDSYKEVEARRKRLRGVIRDCLDKLGIVKEAKSRIDSLSAEERRALQVAALGIVKRVEKELYARRYFWSSNELAEFVSVMLSKDISYEDLERLFIKSLLAVRIHSRSNRYHYYTMAPIPNTVNLIKELAGVVESE